MTRPFANNLRCLDRVMDIVSKRHGKVAIQPRESTRMTKVIFDGRSSGQYVDVMNLRLVLDGKVAEDVPPIDGEPPGLPAKVFAGSRTPAPSSSSALDLLKAKREQNAHAMTALNGQFSELKAENEKIDRAIAALSS